MLRSPGGVRHFPNSEHPRSLAAQIFPHRKFGVQSFGPEGRWQRPEQWQGAGYDGGVGQSTDDLRDLMEDCERFRVVDAEVVEGEEPIRAEMPLRDWLSTQIQCFIGKFRKL